jgi:hypothetical protein
MSVIVPRNYRFIYSRRIMKVLALLSFISFSGALAASPSPMDTVFKSVTALSSVPASNCSPFQKFVAKPGIFYILKLDEPRAFVYSGGLRDAQIALDQAAYHHDFSEQQDGGWLTNLDGGNFFQTYERLGESHLGKGSHKWELFMERAGNQILVCSVRTTIIGEK